MSDRQIIFYYFYDSIWKSPKNLQKELKETVPIGITAVPDILSLCNVVRLLVNASQQTNTRSLLQFEGN